jgi:hypothetical protein
MSLSRLSICFPTHPPPLHRKFFDAKQSSKKKKLKKAHGSLVFAIYPSSSLFPSPSLWAILPLLIAPLNPSREVDFTCAGLFFKIRCASWRKEVRLDDSERSSAVRIRVPTDSFFVGVTFDDDDDDESLFFIPVQFFF